MNENEKQVVTKMIALYCRAHHTDSKDLCEECATLNRYSLQRLENCPYADQKPSCSTCPIHCYKAEMRLQIKQVMQYSGKRMLLHHPIDAIVYLLKNRKKSLVSLLNTNKILTR